MICALTPDVVLPAGIADDEAEAEARNDERSRIGREIHDATAQTLVSLQLQIIYLREMIDDPRFLDKLGEVQSTIDELHGDIRAVCSLGNLSPLDRGKLPAALGMMAERFGNLTGLDIRFSTSGAFGSLAHRAEVSIYRMAQEALANVFSHANATAVRMSLNTVAGQLRLIVSDNGKGPNETAIKGHGVGLANVAKRVRELAGQFDFSRSNRGARFAVSIPLDQAAKTEA